MEWKEAKLNLGEKKKVELSNQIGLGFGFGEWVLGNSEEDKSWKANQELIRQESVGVQLHTIQEIENDFGTAISGGLGNGGGQSSPLEQQETDIARELLVNVEPGGGGEIIIEDFVWCS